MGKNRGKNKRKGSSIRDTRVYLQTSIGKYLRKEG